MYTCLLYSLGKYMLFTGREFRIGKSIFPPRPTHRKPHKISHLGKEISY